MPGNLELYKFPYGSGWAKDLDLDISERLRTHHPPTNKCLT